DVSEPIQRSFSSTMTSRPASAKARATARPTTPAPITTHSPASPITAPEQRGHACPSLAPRQYDRAPGDFHESSGGDYAKAASGASKRRRREWLRRLGVGRAC